MAVTITVSASAVALAELQATYGGGKRGRAARAIQAAVSRTVTTGVALISRRIGQEVHLPIGDIKASIFSRRGSWDDPTGEISVQKGKTVWLAQFLSAGQRRGVAKKLQTNIAQRLTPKGGVRVRVRKKAAGKYGTTETLPKAFIAVMPKSANIGIFERVGVKRPMKSGRYQGKVREVIRRLRGPSPYGVFANAAGADGAATMLDEVKVKLGDSLAKNLMSQIKRARAGL